jgi:hypothetical protein
MKYHNIHHKILHLGSLVLLYDNKYLQNHGKIFMHLLGPFHPVYISEAYSAKMDTLQGHLLNGIVNDIRLKVYYGLHGSPITQL